MVTFERSPSGVARVFARRLPPSGFPSGFLELGPSGRVGSGVPREDSLVSAKVMQQELSGSCSPNGVRRVGTLKVVPRVLPPKGVPDIGSRWVPAKVVPAVVPTKGSPMGDTQGRILRGFPKGIPRTFPLRCSPWLSPKCGFPKRGPSEAPQGRPPRESP
jgi:hypothetical protein